MNVDLLITEQPPPDPLVDAIENAGATISVAGKPGCYTRAVIEPVLFRR